MVLTDKKQVLIEIIEDADDKLTGLLLALANEYHEINPTYSEEEMDNFYRIRDQMLAHPETTYTPEQVRELIIKKK
jgi:hypothetical protein